MVDQQPEGLWCSLRGSSSTDRGLPTTAGQLPSFPQSFPECFAATCPFKTSQLARWLLANIATSRLQCRKPSLLKVVNKPALQIPRGATRRCGLSEGGWESGRRRGVHSGWSAGPSCAFTTLSVFPGVSLYWPLHYLLWLGFRPFTFLILHRVSLPNVMEHNKVLAVQDNTA